MNQVEKDLKKLGMSVSREINLEIVENGRKQYKPWNTWPIVTSL